MKTIRIVSAFLFVMMMVVVCATAEILTTIPRIDSSTARIPITDAIYAYFAKQGAVGPQPVCSKTHGAWQNLANGTADIIFLVAPTAEELQLFADAGIDIEMKSFGYDGLVFMGNASNPIDDISSAHIRAIYRGDITNWWGVDHERGSGDITAYIRNAESGSQRLFEDLVWKGYELPDFQSLDFIEGEVKGASSLFVADDMAGVTFSVLEEHYSIGFNIMSYVDNEFPISNTRGTKVVTTGSVNLREGPGLSYEKLCAVPAGTELEYKYWTEYDDRDIAWHMVDYQGMELWVSSKYSKVIFDNATLKLFSIDGVEPTTAHFLDGTYPYVTTSYVAIRADEPMNSPARRLFDWIGTDESRGIIEKNSTLSVDFTESVVIHPKAGDPMRPKVSDLIDRLPEYTLEWNDLRNFSDDELVYIWQACYAHMGKTFKQQKYRDYFGTMKWYFPMFESYGAASTAMTPRLRKNCDLLMQYMTALRRAEAAVQPRIFEYTEDEPCMHGDDVLEINRILTDMGLLDVRYYSDTYTEASQEAVMSFQQSNGQTATGILDPLTRMMLM